MKIQNKYVFRTIISEFLYLKKKTRGSSMAARPKACWFDVAAKPKVFGSNKELSGGLKINSLG
jgi:hypothetical protein